MQVSVVIYKGEDYSSYKNALNDGAVYDFITSIQLDQLSVKDFAVDKVMSVSSMLGHSSIVAVIIAENGHIIGEIEFGNINYETLEEFKPAIHKSVTRYLVIGWNYETGMGAKTIVGYPSHIPMEEVFDEVNINFRRIAEERCGDGDKLWVAGITKIDGHNPETYACDESPEYDEYGFKSKKTFRYHLNINTVWFGGDNGEVIASSYHEARKLAMKEIENHISKINSRISDFDEIQIDSDNITVEEV